MRLAQTDRNQAEIVRVLRAAGCSVQSLHAVGGGVPDLAVGRAGRNYFLEVKGLVGKRAPKAAPMKDTQVEWHRQWRGQVQVVTTPDEALRAVGLTPMETP